MTNKQKHTLDIATQLYAMRFFNSKTNIRELEQEYFRNAQQNIAKVCIYRAEVFLEEFKKHCEIKDTIALNEELPPKPEAPGVKYPKDGEVR